jgi:threonine dehydratase
MFLVSEDELMRAIATMAQYHALIVEGAGAAPLAALLRYREAFAGQRVALLITGRNLDVHTLARALAP